MRRTSLCTAVALALCALLAACANKGSMDVDKKDDGTYLLTSHTGTDPAMAMPCGTGGTAVVDVEAGTVAQIIELRRLSRLFRLVVNCAGSRALAQSGHPAPRC